MPGKRLFAVGIFLTENPGGVPVGNCGAVNSVQMRFGKVNIGQQQ